MLFTSITLSVAFWSSGAIVEIKRILFRNLDQPYYSKHCGSLINHIEFNRSEPVLLCDSYCLLKTFNKSQGLSSFIAGKRKMQPSHCDCNCNARIWTSVRSASTSPSTRIFLDLHYNEQTFCVSALSRFIHFILSTQLG